jgi:hypothetical protein
MQKVDQVYGFGGAQVEVWLGGVDRDISQGMVNTGIVEIQLYVSVQSHAGLLP